MQENELTRSFSQMLWLLGFTRIMEAEQLTSQTMFQFVISRGLGFWAYSEGLKLFLMYNVHSNSTFKSPCHRWSDLKSVQLYLRPTWRCFECLVHFMFSTLKQVSDLFHLGCVSYLDLVDFHTSSCHRWPSFVRYRCQTWSDATTGTTSLSGPLWAPWSWRNASKRYTHHMRETKLLLHQQTVNLQTLRHIFLM